MNFYLRTWGDGAQARFGVRYYNGKEWHVSMFRRPMVSVVMSTERRTPRVFGNELKMLMSR